MPRYVRSKPLVLTKIDNDDEKYLKVTFSDGFTRKMAKGGKWPPHLAVALHKKAEELLGQKVIIVTSQTTKDWDSKEWLCNIILPNEAGEKEKVEAEFGRNVLWTPSLSCRRFIEFTFIQDKFRDDPDIVSFEERLNKEFDSSWASSKHCRMVNAEFDIRRFRIGKGNLSKRQGYRVTAFKAHEEKGWSWFIILQLDEKLKNEKSFPHDAEMVERAKALINGDRSPDKIRQIFLSFEKCQ